MPHATGCRHSRRSGFLHLRPPRLHHELRQGLDAGVSTRHVVHDAKGRGELVWREFGDTVALALAIRKDEVRVLAQARHQLFISATLGWPAEREVMLVPQNSTPNAPLSGRW